MAKDSQKSKASELNDYCEGVTRAEITNSSNYTTQLWRSLLHEVEQLGVKKKDPRVSLLGQNNQTRRYKVAVI